MLVSKNCNVNRVMWIRSHFSCSINESFIQPIHPLVFLSLLSQYVIHKPKKTWSFSQLVSHSLDQPVSHYFGWWASQSVSQSVCEDQLASPHEPSAAGLWVDPCVSQSISQSWKQPVPTCPWCKSHPLIPNIQHNLKKTSALNLQYVVQN